MNRIFGYEPKIGLEILTNLGSAEALFGLDRDSLDELMGPFSKYRNLIRAEAVDAEAQQLTRLNSRMQQRTLLSRSLQALLPLTFAVRKFPQAHLRKRRQFSSLRSRTTRRTQTSPRLSLRR